MGDVFSNPSRFTCCSFPQKKLSMGLKPQSPRLQAQNSQKKHSLIPKADSIGGLCNHPEPEPSRVLSPVTPDPYCHSAHTARGAEEAASASPARALPRPPSGRVGPAPAPPRPGRAPLSANPPSAAPTGPGPRERREGDRAAAPPPSAGLASAATPLTFSGGCGRQAPPGRRRLSRLRALPHPVLDQLEVRRVEGVEPGERRDGREHGDLKAGEKSRAGWDREAGRGAGPGRADPHPPGGPSPRGEQ